jgi:hypothetical protein
LVVIAAIAVVAVVVLGVVARQYARFDAPLRSVSEVERVPEEPFEAGAPGDAGSSDPEVSGDHGPRVTIPEEMDVGTAVRAFAAGREAVRAFAEEHPFMADSILDEARGDTADRDQVKMFNFQLVDLRVRRAKAVEAEGLDEPSYLAIREQYRLWKAGDPAVDPGWARAFEDHPEASERADLGELDPLDY